MSQVWRINLLGILTAHRNGQEIARFRTLKTGALLGYLAYELRSHSRELLSNLLWPEADMQNGRNSLSVALSSLRGQLEPSGVEFGSVLIADRNFVSLNPNVVTTDVAEFRSILIALKGETESVAQRMLLLQRAVDLYRGRLLEGLYEDWIVREGERLEEIFFGLLDELAALQYSVGNAAEMQRTAERSLSMGPWREAGHRNLILALNAQGQQEGALRHYQHWRENAGTETEDASAVTQSIIAEIERALTKGDTRASVQIERMLAAVSLTSGQREFPEENAEPPLAAEHALPKQEPLQPSGEASLPLRRTRFFGRRVQLQRLVELLVPTVEGNQLSNKLVTLTGMGGSGKTRLAIEAGYRLVNQYRGRLWFIALANLSNPAFLDVALRDALQLLPDPQALPLEQVVEFLAAAPSLLVLDNFEALLPLGATWLTLLQERLPGLGCLVTSRQRLDIEGEAEMMVRPLPIPRKEASFDVEKLLRYAGVQMFVDRARSGRPDFGLTRRNAEAVASLCHALEGLPLALELAAARSSALSPRQLLEQWEQRDKLLRSSRRDLPPRHRSIQAAIEASYSLLIPETQEFFKRQWVFRGGWTAEAAREVCTEPRALHFAVQLRTCSLLYQQERVETVRFSSLETLRDFAGGQLTPAEREALQERHAGYFLAQIDAQAPQKARQSKPMAHFQADLGNYRAALEWYHVAQPEMALRMAAALWPWWEATGNHGEGRAQLERALSAAPDAPARYRAEAHLGAGRLIYHQDFAPARPLLEEALRLFRELEDERGIAMTLCSLSTLLVNLHEPQARDYAQEAQELAQHVGDAFIEAEATYCLGMIDLGLGDMALAREELNGCIAFYRQNEDLRNLNLALDVVAMAAWGVEDFEQAGVLFDESLLVARRLRWQFMIAHSLWGVSAVARSQGKTRHALEAARESLSLVRQGRFLWFVPYALANLAHAELEAGEVGRAVTLLGAAEAQHEVLGTPLMPLFFATYEHYKAKAQAVLEEEPFEMLWERGRSFTSEEAIAFGLS